MAEFRSLFNRARQFAGTLSHRGLVTYAAACAFYSFLSLFPMAALAASLMPCVGVEQAALLHLFDGLVPSGVAAVLQLILTNVYKNVFPALPLSLLVLLWSSAQAFTELLQGMAAMAGKDAHFGYLKRRLRAILLTVALMTTLLLSLAVLIFGARLVALLGAIYPGAMGLLEPFLWFRYICMALLLWLLFALLYRSIPSRNFSFREVRTGAALAAAAWVLFSALFSWYAGRFLDLSLYGGLAALVVTMLWLFYCQYILLIGAGICGQKHDNKEAAVATAAS